MIYSSALLLYIWDLDWKYSARREPSIWRCRLLSALQRAEMTDLDQIFCMRYFLCIWRAPSKIFVHFFLLWPPQKGRSFHSGCFFQKCCDDERVTSGRGVDDWTINYIGRQANYRLPIYSCSVINTRRCKQRSTEPELLTHFHFPFVGLVLETLIHKSTHRSFLRNGQKSLKNCSTKRPKMTLKST